MAAESAGKLRDALQAIMGIRRGETALIVYDAYARPVSDVTRRALELEGVIVHTYVLPADHRPLKDVPDVLARLIETLHSDLYFNQLEGIGEETPFRTMLLTIEEEQGGRIGHSPDINMAMVEGPMTADVPAMKAAAAMLKKRLRRVKTVRVTAPGGTDVAFSIARRAFDDDITIGPGHMGNLPAGEIWCAPVETSLNGLIVCDGSIGDVGMVPAPLLIHVKDGKVTRLECEDQAFADRVAALLAVDPDASLAGEFGIGMNPKARITGLLLEDEKAYGTVHIAFGQNTDMPGGKNMSMTHRDFLIKSPSIIDVKSGEYVMRDGELI